VKVHVSLLERRLLAPDAFGSLDPVARLGHDPFAGEVPSLPSARRGRTPADLAEALAARQRQLGCGEAAAQNAAALAQDDAVAVVTGQQAGLGTGPLYTVHKILSALALAERLRADAPGPVVPVFWHATEDHDLSEVKHLHTAANTWTAAFPEQGQAAEALPAEPARAALDELLAALQDQPWHAELTALLAELPMADYGTFASALVARLFRDTGLVILEPRDLRPWAGDCFRLAVQHRDAIRQALAAGAEAMRAAGLTVPIEPPGGAFGLFALDAAGVRRPVQESGDAFTVQGERLGPEALLARVSEQPERFSTGVFLRPVLQGLLLPVQAYVAGPGELRYHLQLREVFGVFGEELPALLPRQHGTLLRPADRKLMDKLQLAPADIFAGPQPLYRRVELPAERAAVFTQAESELDALLEHLHGETADLLNERSVGAARKKMRKELDKLRRQATREYRRAHEVDNGRIDRLFAHLLPRNRPQERVLNVLPYLAAFGPDLLDALRADPFELRHHLWHL